MKVLNDLKEEHGGIKVMLEILPRRRSIFSRRW